MKTRMNILKLIIIVLALSSCKKDDVKQEPVIIVPTVQLSDDNYLIFGHFYGLCYGEECVEIFALETNRLLEDTTDVYPYSQYGWDSSQGIYIDIGKEKYNLVKDLIYFFPPELLDETQEVLGCPDCVDGGGIYIEYKFNGIDRTWFIDQETPNVPEYLHNFINKVNETIMIINE